MAWYYGTFACGHKGRVNVIGPVKNRQWKADRYFAGVCDDCEKKMHEAKKEAEYEEALKTAEEYELPDIQGTEKQIQWAMTLRQKLIDKFDNVTDDDIEWYSEELGGLKKEEIEDIKYFIYFILENRTSAAYYIDHRFDDLLTYIKLEKDFAFQPKEEKIAKQHEQEIQAKLDEEATVYPEKRVTDAVVKIEVLDDKIEVRFEKNDEFRSIVKSLGYRWDGCWERSISETTGSAADRAAELGNKLLNAGFPIRIYDEEIRKKAIDGDFEPECHRWIYRRIGTEKLSINWGGYNNDLYKRAKSLPGAKWDRGMLVDVAHYEEVEEFARLFGFKFSTGARELIEKHKEKIKNIETVEPAIAKKQEEKDGLKEILESSDEVLDDLKEE